METVLFCDVSEQQVKGLYAAGILISEDCGLQLGLRKRLQAEGSPNADVEIRSSACNWRISFPSGEKLDGRVLQNANCRLLADAIASRMSVRDCVAKMSYRAKRGLRLEFERGISVDFFLENRNATMPDMGSGDTYHTAYLFRMYGIPGDGLRKWENAFKGFDHLPCRSIIHPDSYVISIDLTTESVAKRLLRKLGRVSIPYDYCIEVFMVSVTDSNGLTVPDHVMHFHEKLGGDFFVGFSLVS